MSGVGDGEEEERLRDGGPGGRVGLRPRAEPPAPRVPGAAPRGAGRAAGATLPPGRCAGALQPAACNAPFPGSCSAPARIMHRSPISSTSEKETLSLLWGEGGRRLSSGQRGPGGGTVLGGRVRAGGRGAPLPPSPSPFAGCELNQERPTWTFNPQKAGKQDCELLLSTVGTAPPRRGEDGAGASARPAGAGGIVPTREPGFPPPPAPWG